jgi:membrane protein DedA with SNARE-associated domain
MAEHILDLLREYLTRYGYGAVAVVLLLENMGLPLPGETILLLASALAYSQPDLRLSYIIVIAICAATLGDNFGFAIGHYGGRRLLDRYRSFFRIHDTTIARGEALFHCHGAATIFFARFIAGLRIIAGPLAGVLRMNWKKFALFNFMGATLWVGVIATVGYYSGKHMAKFAKFLKTLDMVSVTALCVLVAVLLGWYWKSRHSAAR